MQNHRPRGKLFLASGNFCHPLDNLCKQFGPWSDPTKCRSWSGSKLFDTISVPDIFFEKKWFWKRQQKQTIWTQIRTDKMLVLIWVQNVWHYQCSWYFFEKKNFEKCFKKNHDQLPSRQRELEIMHWGPLMEKKHILVDCREIL